MRFRKERVIFTLECLPEDTSAYRELDKDQYGWVKRQEAKGNEWAWCCAKVTASIQHPYDDGETLVGVDYLGQCMYLGREDFMADGYWKDMKLAALDALREAWDDLVEVRNEAHE